MEAAKERPAALSRWGSGLGFHWAAFFCCLQVACAMAAMPDSASHAVQGSSSEVKDQCVAFLAAMGSCAGRCHQLYEAVVPDDVDAEEMLSCVAVAIAGLWAVTFFVVSSHMS